MRYNVRGNNVEVTDAIREYVIKKLSRLEKYFDTTPTSDVNVRLRVYNNNQKVEVTIPMPNLLLRAEDTNPDMYAAIDLVVDKLERQIRKHKTKVNRKFRQDGSVKHIFAELEKANGKEESDELEIVRTKRFTLKPMDVEEAVLQMNMLDHNFFVYMDAETGNTNVVYRRKDGRYGLIEPE